MQLYTPQQMPNWQRISSSLMVSSWSQFTSTSQSSRINQSVHFSLGPVKKRTQEEKALFYVVFLKKAKNTFFFQEISEQRLPFGTARPISRSVHQTTSVLRCAALISDTVAACVGAFCEKPSSRRIVIIIISHL